MHKQVLDIFYLCLKKEKSILESTYECTMQWYVARWKQNQLNIFLFMYLFVIHWKHNRLKETVHFNTHRKHAEMHRYDMCKVPRYTQSHIYTYIYTYIYILFILHIKSCNTRNTRQCFYWLTKNEEGNECHVGGIPQKHISERTNIMFIMARNQSIICPVGKRWK